MKQRGFKSNSAQRQARGGDGRQRGGVAGGLVGAVDTDAADVAEEEERILVVQPLVVIVIDATE